MLLPTVTTKKSLDKTEHLQTIPDPRQLIPAQRRQAHLAVDAEHWRVIGDLVVRVAREDEILVGIVDFGTIFGEIRAHRVPLLGHLEGGQEEPELE